MREFYIGYLPHAPAGIRRVVRLAVVSILLLAVAGAVLFAASQRGFANSSFAFGHPLEYRGTVVAQPYPALLVESPGEPPRLSLLTAPGKHGADALISPWTGKSVSLRGTPIERDSLRMIELEPASLQSATSSPLSAPVTEDLGIRTLRGEIADSKCFLGVMNPGDGKVHHDCAVRCLSGGQPPLFFAPDLPRPYRIIVLAGEDGRALPPTSLLSLVARPVEIRGHLYRTGNLVVLQIAPREIRALP